MRSSQTAPASEAKQSRSEEPVFCLLLRWHGQAVRSFRSPSKGMAGPGCPEFSESIKEGRGSQLMPLYPVFSEPIKKPADAIICQHPEEPAEAGNLVKPSARRGFCRV